MFVLLFMLDMWACPEGDSSCRVFFFRTECIALGYGSLGRCSVSLGTHGYGSLLLRVVHPYRHTVLRVTAGKHLKLPSGKPKPLEARHHSSKPRNHRPTFSIDGLNITFRLTC